VKFEKKTHQRFLSTKKSQKLFLVINTSYKKFASTKKKKKKKKKKKNLIKKLVGSSELFLQVFGAHLLILH